MDAVLILGLAGSIVNIVDIIAKSTLTLRKLQNQWQAADCTVNSLLGQLGTLKVALYQIQEWICSELTAEAKYQLLVDDLSSSLDCCSTLISLLDSHISQLEWKAADKLTSKSKVKAMLDGSVIREYVTQLNSQLLAFNLLLTALNCRSLSEQKALLERRQSRDVLARVKDGTSSLICLRDSTSFADGSGRSPWGSHCTSTSSLISREFDFDAALQSSRVYQSHLRSLLRRRVRKQILKHRASKEPPVEALEARPSPDDSSSPDSDRLPNGHAHDLPNFLVGFEGPSTDKLVSEKPHTDHHPLGIDAPSDRISGRTASEIASDVWWEVVDPSRVLGEPFLRRSETAIHEQDLAEDKRSTHRSTGHHESLTSSQIANEREINESKFPGTALPRIWAILSRQGRMAGSLLEASRSYGVHCP